MDYETIRTISGMVGMFFFIATFLGVVVWTFRPSSKRDMDQASQIPFKEEQ